MMNGREAIQYEMARQHADALHTFATAGPLAAVVAQSVRRTGKLCLLGMGGSHWVNRTVMFAYRELGIEVQAEVLSEALFSRLPDHPRTVLLVSQSGNSGEVGRYLETPDLAEERFGMTLNEESILAKSIPTLVGAGGIEKAFAATRSIFISHALHLAVLGALGANVDDVLNAIQNPVAMLTDQGRDVLLPCSPIILSGRNHLQGVAESGALCLMELARMPTYALEGGQLRHGPFEMLNEDCGIIFFRADDQASKLTEALAHDCRKADTKLIVFDLSGQAPIADAVTFSFKRQHGMAAVFTVLPALQALLVNIASEKVENVGVPLRSTKVTTAL